MSFYGRKSYYTHFILSASRIVLIKIEIHYANENVNTKLESNDIHRRCTNFDIQKEDNRTRKKNIDKMNKL